MYTGDSHVLTLILLINPMDFKEVQKKVIENAKKYEKKFDVKIDKEFTILKLTEELGEVAEAILIHDRKSRPSKHIPAAKAKENLAMELADVVGMAIVLASLYNADLEKALDEKWISKNYIR
jgi:NTP pyrophosphatase (non-canonical NTP hydrolase)